MFSRGRNLLECELGEIKSENFLWFEVMMTDFGKSTEGYDLFEKWMLWNSEAWKDPKKLIDWTKERPIFMTFYN